MLFKKPSWLKPEINEPIYYLHLVILFAAFIYIMKLFGYDTIPTTFSFELLWKSVVALTASDTLAHTLLRLD